MKSYDVIIVGAGSVGVPAALACAEAGLKTLVVDKRPSPGQGENKHAIGGIRATHSDPAKIIACHRSLALFATWEALRGDNIEWLRGGYVFPVYRPEEERLLKSYLPVQKRYGLNIDYVSPEEIRKTVPGINPHGLRGGTVSPDDGSASPLLAVNAFHRRAVALGARFLFDTEVRAILKDRGTVSGVRTATGEVAAPVVVEAAGANSRELSATLGCDMPVVPESHEAAITEPVAPFCPAMVVDLRPRPGSRNYYFYQNRHGQVVFCITPDPPVTGMDYRETSGFLPQVCSRMVELMPRLKNLRVRRVWRGLYPMTADGSPFLGWNRDVGGLLHATGMCGQGFMLGPGLGEVIARMITRRSTPDDHIILDRFSLYRDVACGVEALK